MKLSAIVAIAFAVAVCATPALNMPRDGFVLQNGIDAKNLNQKFASLNANSPCTYASGENACVGTDFAHCANGRFVTFPCNAGLICAALPLVLSPGTSIACTTAADRDTRIPRTGA